MRKTNYFAMLAGTVVACGFGLPAVAQQGQQQSYDQQSNERDQRQRNRRTAQERREGRQQRRQARQGQSQQDRQLRLRPSGWVRVAVDYDQDDRFDAFETIYHFDLVQARERSAQRRGQRGREGRGDSVARSRTQGQQVSGEISDLRTFRLTDGGPQRLAKLRTQNGRTVRVLLGSTDQISRLNLQDGDRITVWGTQTRLNDRPVLAARRIETGDQRITVDPLPRRDLRRIRGQIASIRTAEFRGRDQQFRVARVNVGGDRTRTVILGPQSRLEGFNLQRGDDIRLLVRRGQLNGQPALIAEQIRANERTVRIQRPEGRRITSRRQ